MPHDAFELMDVRPVATLRVTVETYRHRATGARHIHLAAPDPHNAFLVGFLTVSMDDTGIAHILEHTALCGSERYPVRDPFFMMLRRSLSTFMNAFTSSDWTAYPFASLSRKDFFNLLHVYLDAAFFPNLQELDFAQEGCRVEFATPGDPASELVYKGVVFNEMKGAMSSPSRVLWQTMARHLFPTTTYHFNSGGEPESIPDLTWAQLKAFHAHHYHPSNAVFMTYGDIPAEELQKDFQERALQRFQRSDVSYRVPDEVRLNAPVVVEETYPVDGETAEKTHIVLAWLWGKSFDLESLLEAHLLNDVLLDNSSSPLMHALETSELGSAPSPICGLDDSEREMIFVCGLEGSEPEHAADVEAEILAVLKRVADEGVEPERVEAVLHQLELSRREISGDGYPYGLKLMLDALPSALHGGDPAAVLDLDPVLERLREKVKDPAYVRGLAQRWLVDNPHRVRLTLRPDTELAARRQAAEKERLAQRAATMGDGERLNLLQRMEELEARQKHPDDPEILPKVELADVPPDLFIPEGQRREVSGLRSDWYDRPTNGLVYHQVVMDLPVLEPELVDLFPLFVSMLPKVGSAGRDYLATQAWQAAVTGGVGARVHARGDVGEATSMRCLFRVAAKALERNREPMARLVRETLEQARFDERPRLRELVAQMKAAAEESVTDSGHSYALSAAAAGFSPAAALSDRWGGLVSVRRLKALDRELDDPDRLRVFSDQLARLGELVRQAPRQLLVVGEGDQFDAMASTLHHVWEGGGGHASGASFSPVAGDSPPRVGWGVQTQVQFCAKVYPAVPANHPDAPILAVLGQFLRNGYLHRAIREQGGAYGSGAGYDGDSATFRFHSYRDPRLEETLRDFDLAVTWLQETNHPFRTLEEAILGVVGAIDRPGSPAGEAIRAYYDALHGRAPERRRAFRQGVLKVTVEDLKRVATLYLQPERSRVAVVASARALDGVRNLEMTIENL